MTGKSEREFMATVKDLDRGWEAQRAPGSGARQDANSGDVWVARKNGKNTELYIAEEKYKSDTDNPYAYLYGGKLDKMIEFAENIGATPIVAVRYSNRISGDFEVTHYCADAGSLERTESGNISISPEKAVEVMQTADDFF